MPINYLGVNSTPASVETNNYKEKVEYRQSNKILGAEQKTDISSKSTGFDEILKNNMEKTAKSLSSSKDFSKNGTNIALKKLAEDIEKEFLSVLWQSTFSSIETDNSFGTQMFSEELVRAMVSDIKSPDDRMSDIALSIYEQAKD